MLSAALTLLCDSGIKTNPTMYQHVKHFKLNPKAITMNQLYGAFDPNTREFIDGVLQLYRNAAADTSMDKSLFFLMGQLMPSGSKI